MGQINLTPKQQIIFDEIKNSNFIKQNFYFTGGTALSAVYLQHRLSEDLDFFSEVEFDILSIQNLITQWGQKYKFTTNFEEKEVVKIFNLEFPDGEKLKVDFGYYPYKRLRNGKFIKGVEVDSLFDIAVNKLQTIRQRSDMKDFVDLYFLLKEYTIWDLMEGARVKFRMEPDPYLIAVDFLKVEKFDVLPKMLVPLEISWLQNFYKELAKKLGKTITTALS